MTGRLHLKASHPAISPRLAKFYTSHLDEYVFPRSAEQLAHAANEATLLHLETPHRQIVGVCGVFESKNDIHDVGGLRITQNGYRLQIPMMQTAAVTLHLTREPYVAITATTFADNVTSIRNMTTAGFVPWRSAPRALMDAKASMAGGRQFHVFHAPPPQLRQMAQELVRLMANPVIDPGNGKPPIELVLEHPLFTVWADVLHAFAGSQDEADEDLS